MTSPGMRIVDTGGVGFIGSHVVDQLVALDDNVLRSTPSTPSTLPPTLSVGSRSGSDLPQASTGRWRVEPLAAPA